MRVLWERQADDAGFHELDVAVPAAAVPVAGDRVRWGAHLYQVVDVFPWNERYSGALDLWETAVILRVRLDEGADAAGVRELNPAGPGPLSSGAEAVPPDDIT